MQGKRGNVLFGVVLFMAVLAVTFAVNSKNAEAGAPLKLKVQGTHIVNSKGKKMQLKGISTHGLSWYPEYVNKKAFKYMKKNWKINTVRLAMYTAEYNGYCTGDATNRQKLIKLIDDGVKYAEDAGLYVIIDWHILSDGNPLTYKKKSLKFFEKMAKKYSGKSHVIYEICNEPNGAVTWKNVKSYAESVLKVIRKYDKDAIVIVGSTTWSQDVDIAAADKLSEKYGNVVYALHFYASTHGENLRQKAQKALDAGLPLLVSEFGICDASGSGGINKKEAKNGLTFFIKTK